MKFLGVIIISVLLIHQSCSLLIEERLEEMKSNRTFMQIWRDHIKLWREEIGSTSSEDYGLKFDCDPFNHTNFPTSVHQLTPGDIEIVGALGASFMAGMGAGADSLFTLLLEYRGISYAIGGDGDLSQMVTIPNILKQYNPDLFGQSYRVAPVWYEKFSQLNLAVSGEKSENLKNQAKLLVKRIKDIPLQDQKWKLININIGTTDVCQYCENRRSTPLKWIKDYKKALDYLYSNLRKTFVNVISIRSNSILKVFQENYPVCKWFLNNECPCLNHEQLDVYESEFNHLLSNLVERYNRHDFTVEFQPFWTNVSLKVNVSGSSNNDSSSDLSYMAPDCFHLSQKGHASAARSLWKNMLQSHGDKSDEWNLNEHNIHCPNSSCPFLRTRRNSIYCEYNVTEESSEETFETDTTDMFPDDEEWSTRETRTRHTRQPYNITYPIDNKSTIYIHHLTKNPPGLVTVTNENILKAHHDRSVDAHQSGSALPWIIAGILGTLVIALMTLLIAQNYMHKKTKSTRRLTESSPLLPRENDEQ